MAEAIRKIIRRYGRAFFLYLLAGGFCALIDWSGFYLLYTSGLSYTAAALLAFVAATFVNYLLSRQVFKARRKKTAREAAGVYLASLAALAVDISVMTALINALSAPPLLAKITGTGVAFFINYGARQFYIFK